MDGDEIDGGTRVITGLGTVEGEPKLGRDSVLVYELGNKVGLTPGSDNLKTREASADDDADEELVRIWELNGTMTTRAGVDELNGGKYVGAGVETGYGG